MFQPTEVHSKRRRIRGGSAALALPRGGPLAGAVDRCFGHVWNVQCPGSVLAMVVSLLGGVAMAHAETAGSIRQSNEVPVVSRDSNRELGIPLRAQDLVQDDESTRLEQFLESRGLTRLLIVHVERQLDRTSLGPQRDQLVKKLAELYERQLTEFESTQTSENRERMIRRAESLLRLNRHLNLDGLELAILSARFRKLESAIRTWWYDGNDPSQRNGLANSMREIFDSIDDLRRRNLERFQKLQADLPMADDQQTRTRELAEIERLVLKSQFLSGWAGVWISVLGQGSEVWAEESIRHFRAFLELPENEPIGGLEAKWYAFQTDWHVRAWVGLAYAHAQLGDLATHARIFEQLGQAAAGNEVALWQIDSHAFARQWRAIVSLAHAETKRMTSRTGRLSIWLALARCAVAAQESDMAPQLAQVSTRGLLRDFQAGAIERLLNDTLQPSWLDDVTLKWARAMIVLEQREAGTAELEDALRSLQWVFSETTTDGTGEDAGRLEYLIGLALYRLGRPGEAQQHLERAVDELRDEAAEFAEAAAWLRIQSLVTLATRDPDSLGKSLAALDEFRTQFPASQHLDELPRLRNRLLAGALPPRLAVRRLQVLYEQSPADVDLAVELADQLFRYWRLAWKTDRERAEAVGRTFDEVTQRLLSEEAVEPRVAAGLQLRRVHMRLTQKIPLPQWADELERLGRWQKTIQADRELRRAYQFVQLQIAIVRNDRETAERLAREMLESSLADADVLPALIWLAEDLRERGELSADQKRLAIEVNRRILEYYQSEKSDEMSANEAVAAWDLVKLLDQENRRNEAKPWLERLVHAFPDREPYLVLRARWLVDDARWTEALGLWRRLAIAAAAGSELWYEAKWNVVRCLARTDPQAARQVAEQTINLSPQMPEKWRQRFDREVGKLNSESEKKSPPNDDEASR